MLKVFKRRRPAHRVEPVQISREDAIIAAHHRLTAQQWNALPALVKVDKREQVAFELRQAS